MATGTYTGTTARIYGQYLNLDQGGHTLVVQPQDTCDVAVAQGWTGLAALPGDGQWAAVTRGPLTFTFTLGSAIIGAASVGFPGYAAGYRSVLAAEPEETEPAEPGPEEMRWAEDVMAEAAAGETPIFREIRDRLASMDAQVAVLRSRKRP